MKLDTIRQLEPTFDAPLHACPLCHQREPRPFDHDFAGVKIDACSACGLRFMNPQYTDEHLAALYGGEGDYLHPVALDQFREHERYGYQRTHFDFVQAHAPSGRLLCIGCGDGIELAIAKELGYEAQGLDLDPEIADIIRREIGVTVEIGTFPDHPMEPGQLDVVFMDQLLEHVKQPRAYLERAFEVLAPGGHLFIGVPNIGSLSSWWKTVAGKLGLKRRSRGKHYDTWHHLTYFRPSVLRHATMDVGFETVAISGDPLPNKSPLPAAVERRFKTGSTFIGLFRKPG